MIEPGRNHPCPCGSGKKYKHCHGLALQQLAASADPTWKRLRRVLDGFPDTMFRFVQQVYSPDVIQEAWEEFTGWQDDLDFDPDTPHMSAFMPWFFHQWAPDPLDTHVADPALHDRAPTTVLLERRGNKLDPLLRRYLEACVATPFSFHEIIRSQPGVGFRARDMFLGRELEVLEASASETMQVGDAFFGQLVTCDGITLLEACGPYPIPPVEKIPLIELRERIARGTPEVTAEDLAEWDIELRDAYHRITDWLMDPALPELRNTEGHELAFHTLTFAIDSAEEAFDALKHLARTDPPEQVEEAAERDEEGRLVEAAFAWRDESDPGQQQDSTILGHIEIGTTLLVALLNSAERAARFRGIMEGALRGKARLVDTEIEFLEDRLMDEDDEELDLPEGLDPAEHPELRQHLEAKLAAHYDAWISEELPALDGLTPQEAIKDRAGREKVAALIDQIERTGRRMDPPMPEGIIAKLRQRLGLSHDP